MLALILAAAVSAASCANPGIVSTGVQAVTTNNGLSHYTLAVMVQNLGPVRQPSNLLQSLDVLQDGEKVGRIGLRPLRPHESQKVTYSFDRSADADTGSTEITFTLDLNGRAGNNVDCHSGKETVTINV